MNALKRGGRFPATLTVSDERTDAGPDGATTSASTTKPVAVNRSPNATQDGGAIDICADGTKTTDIDVVENDADDSKTTVGETVDDQTAYRDQDGDLIGVESVAVIAAPEARNKIRYTPPAAAGLLSFGSYFLISADKLARPQPTGLVRVSCGGLGCRAPNPPQDRTERATARQMSHRQANALTASQAVIHIFAVKKISDQV